jgi:ribosomal protein S18 acetylase RimI-like enzyme
MAARDSISRLRIFRLTEYSEKSARVILKQCESIERERFGIDEDDSDVRSRSVKVQEGWPGRLDAVVAGMPNWDIVRVVGFAYLDRTTPGEIYLDTLAVSKDWEGMGIAGKLLREVDRIATESRVRVVWLKVDMDWNAPDGPRRLIAIYEKHGYHIVGDPSEFTDRFNRKTIMAKRYDSMYRAATPTTTNKPYGATSTPAIKMLTKDEILRAADAQSKQRISGLLEGYRTGRCRIMT